jgi:hypothetical protein
VTIIERLRALLAEATPGPWAWTETGGPFALVMGPDGDELVHVRMNLGLGSNPDRDAALIAAAVNALPALLDVAEAARDYLAHDRDTNALAAALARLDVAP